MPPRFRRFVIVLAVVQAIIIGVHLATLVAAYGFGHDWLWGLNELFDVDEERNIPTYFSLGLLLVAAVQLAMIAWSLPRDARPRRVLWAGLSAVVFYMAADEGFELHEKVGYLTSKLVDVGELTYYAWLLPYAVLGLVFVVAYRRFLFQLPRDIRNQILIAGIIYASGAFGTEVLGGIYVHFNHTEHAFGYDLLSALEETLEMAGVIWLINALSFVLEKKSAPVREHRGAVVQADSSASTSA